MLFILLLSIQLIVLAESATCSAGQTAADMVQGRDLTGQIHVVTGGDSGMGYETSVALASKNASVVLACRSPKKCSAAAANITKLSGNAARVSVVNLDLSSFGSVRSAAAEIRRHFPRIDVLICNAGMGANSASLPHLTEDGFDRVLQVDFLSHFLLVELLLPTLRRSGGRVVHVSSMAAMAPCTFPIPWVPYGRLDCTDLSKLPKEASATPSGIMPASNYGLAKWLMVFHAAELVRRETRLTAYSLHPGVVATAMTKDLPNWIAKLFCLKDGQKPCPCSDKQGASTQTYLAAASTKELGGASMNGRFFDMCAPSAKMDVRAQYADEHGEEQAVKYQSALYEMAKNMTTASFAAADGDAPTPASSAEETQQQAYYVV